MIIRRQRFEISQMTPKQLLLFPSLHSPQTPACTLFIILLYPTAPRFSGSLCSVCRRLCSRVRLQLSGMLWGRRAVNRVACRGRVRGSIYPRGAIVLASVGHGERRGTRKHASCSRILGATASVVPSLPRQHASTIGGQNHRHRLADYFSGMTTIIWFYCCREGMDVCFLDKQALL